MVSASPSAPEFQSRTTAMFWFLFPVVAVIVHHYWPYATPSSSPWTSVSATPTSQSPPPLDFGTGSMFDLIAHRYDFINRVLALQMDVGWRRHMTSEIKDRLLQQSMADQPSSTTTTTFRLLDIATGTADVALQLASEFMKGPNKIDVTILGLDPSPNMLNVGRSKVTKQNLDDTIVLEVADARDLSKYYPLSGNDDTTYFDAATISFGIRNVVPGRSDALCEIHKLLKPQTGILAILEFSEPTYDENGILGLLARSFIRHVVPRVGAFLSGGYQQEYLHLQNSIKDFPTPSEFKSQLQNLHCNVLSPEVHGNTMEGYFDMEDVQSMNFGSVHLYLGRAKTRAATTPPKTTTVMDDPKLPPIVPKYEVTELHTAAANGDIQTMTRILENEASTEHERSRLVNAKDPNGWTPLHEAVRHGDYDTVQLLLKYGADVNARTGKPLSDDYNTGPSALYSSLTFYGMDEMTNPIVQLLKEHGARSIPPNDVPQQRGEHNTDEL